MPKTNCIYCDLSVRTNGGEGDHVIPAALGRFKNAIIFRRICPSCNSRIGKFEEQIMKCGPESFLRRALRVEGRRGRPTTALKGAGGARPPHIRVRRGGGYVVAQLASSDASTIAVPEQLTFESSNGELKYVLLHPTMTAATLKERLERQGYIEGTPLFVDWDIDNEPIYIALIRTLWPNAPYQLGDTISPGTTQVAARIRFEVTPDYFRAITKIAFHYFLCQTRRGLSGSEPEFEFVRSVVMGSADPMPLFDHPHTSPFVFRPDLGPASVPKVPNRWGHFLAMAEDRDDALASISLFAGPEHPPQNYYMKLGQFRSRLWVPEAMSAHAYHYYDVDKRAEHEGWVEKVSMHA